MPPLLEWFFSLLCFRFQIEVFSYCTFTETFAVGFQKWFDDEWIVFLVFWWQMASVADFRSVWTKICKECSIVILFGRYQISSMFSLRGILVCSLKMLLLFSRRILYYRLVTFKNANQLYFLSFVFSSLFFLEIEVKSFDYFWKSKSLFFKFCVNCLLIFDVLLRVL